MPCRRYAAMLVVVALLAATVTVLSSCSQPTPTVPVPKDQLAPTSVAPPEGGTQEGYPPPEEVEEYEPPPGPGTPGYPPPASATPTLYSYPEAEETPEAEE